MCLYARDLRISEGEHIQRILRRSTSRVKVRRAQVVLASNPGYKVPAIADLVHYSEPHVRAIIKEFNERGLKALEPKPRPGRPTEFSKEFVIRGTHYQSHQELETFLNKSVRYRNQQN